MPALNPNHPLSQAAGDEFWYKIAAMMVVKNGGVVHLTAEDFEAMPDKTFLSVRDAVDGVHLHLIDEATANALARKHGGLPS